MYPEVYHLIKYQYFNVYFAITKILLIKFQVIFF